MSWGVLDAPPVAPTHCSYQRGLQLSGSWLAQHFAQQIHRKPDQLKLCATLSL